MIDPFLSEEHQLRKKQLVLFNCKLSEKRGGMFWNFVTLVLHSTFEF